MTVAAEASEKDRRKEMDGLLQRLLGTELSTGETLERKSLGSLVHIFSHIRMTLHVEKMALQVQDTQTVLVLVQAGSSIALAILGCQCAVYESVSPCYVATWTKQSGCNP